MDGAVNKVLETFDAHVAASNAALTLEMHTLEIENVRFAVQLQTLRGHNASQTAQLALETQDLTKTKSRLSSAKTDNTILKKKNAAIDEYMSAVESAASVYSRKMKTANQLDIDRK